MTHLTEERPATFMNGGPVLLSLDVVGFNNIDCNDTVRVSGQHRTCTTLSSLEFERETALRVILTILKRQGQLEKGEDDSALRNFEAIPCLATAGLGQVWNG